MRNLKTSEIPKIRKQILEEQNFTCPLCGKHIEESDRITLDHQHKNKKSDPNGVNGNGQIRGVLCADCNVCEGKLWNATSRYLKSRCTQDRIDFLKNLIKYYEKPLYDYIHPTEVEKEKDLSKRNFNKLAKLYSEKYPDKKPLEYPKSKKLTKPLEKIYEEFDIPKYN